MRFLTIVLSILLGVALCAIYLNNSDPVAVHFGPFFSGPAPKLVKVEPLWKVMFFCIGFGLIVGYLYGLASTSGHDRTRDRRVGGGAKAHGAGDVDYLIGVKNRERH